MWDFTTSYEVFVFLVPPDRRPPWFTDRWLGIVSELEALADPTSFKDAGIRSLQHEGRPFRRVPFGTLSWNPTSHARWTHTPATTAVFVHAELWSPRWTVCEREGRPPRLFLSMGAKTLRGPVGSCSALLLAVDPQRVPGDLGSAALRLGRLLDAAHAAHATRPWGRAAGTAGYTDGLQDLMMSGLLEPGAHEVRSLDGRILRGAWRAVPLA